MSEHVYKFVEIDLDITKYVNIRSNIDGQNYVIVGYNIDRNYNDGVSHIHFMDACGEVVYDPVFTNGFTCFTVDEKKRVVTEVLKLGLGKDPYE